MWHELDYHNHDNSVDTMREKKSFCLDVKLSQKKKKKTKSKFACNPYHNHMNIITRIADYPSARAMESEITVVEILFIWLTDI